MNEGPQGGFGRHGNAGEKTQAACVLTKCPLVEEDTHIPKHLRSAISTLKLKSENKTQP